MSRILIVDDEPDLLFLLRMILERAGHSVVAASDGAMALERLATGRPDLVITDRMMPIMDGDELIARLRSDPQVAGIPIIVVSAARPQETSGADATLGKPYAAEALLKLVGRFAGQEA